MNESYIEFGDASKYFALKKITVLVFRLKK